MGNVVSVNFSSDAFILTCLNCFTTRASYVCKMEKNLKELQSALDELLDLKKEVEREVHNAQLQEWKPSEKVDRWMAQVETLKVQVNQLITDKGQEIEKLCLGGRCSKNCMSSYRYGKEVSEMLKEITVLKSKGGFDKVAECKAPPHIRQTEPIVGMQSTFDEVLSLLQNNQVGTLGLYGMGGVGKTTLLTHIYNSYVENQSDYTLIDIEVSRNLGVEDIQHSIGSRIGFTEDTWKSKSRREKALDIFRVLHNTKFLLTLDDLWEPIDLKNVGVPIPNETSMYKVIFTTREDDVCSQMCAHRKRVKCLEWDEAWSLFKKNVEVGGQGVLSLESCIPDLAEAVAKECDGLPLALKVVAQVMSNKTTEKEWQCCLRILQKSAAEFPNMKDRVFDVLKLSYENLSGSKVKSCFLYCALFPEHSSIRKDELIYKWMGERILLNDPYETVDEALGMGYSIIGTLVRTCLLEDMGDCIRMHDVIRDMAVWLACEHEEERFLVQPGCHLTKLPFHEEWKVAKRISLMENDIEDLNHVPSCPNLVTLFLGRNRLKMMTLDFFNNMLKLQVLDLSKNKDLSHLPSGVSTLVSLQYLDLSETGIKELPTALKALVNLLYLNLEHTRELETIPHDLISSFSELRLLRLYNSSVCRKIEHLIREIQSFNRLVMLTFTIHNASVYEQFFASNKFLSCTKSLCMDGLSFLDISSLASMKDSYSLTINNCGIVDYKLNALSQSIFKHLKVVNVDNCADLMDLTWLVFAPNLESLSVHSCTDVKEIIQHEKLDVANVQIQCPFAKMQKVILINLPQLESIYERTTLPFKYLKRIEVCGCQRLKKLPLKFSSVTRRDIVITGEEQWWNMLDWEDEETKNAFHPYFRPHN